MIWLATGMMICNDIYCNCEEAHYCELMKPSNMVGRQSRVGKM